jgi:hypothetical protein
MHKESKMETVAITFNPQQFQIMMKGVQMLPYMEAAPFIAWLNSQVSAQQEKPAEDHSAAHAMAQAGTGTAATGNRQQRKVAKKHPGQVAMESAK